MLAPTSNPAPAPAIVSTPVGARKTPSGGTLEERKGTSAQAAETGELRRPAVQNPTLATQKRLSGADSILISPVDGPRGADGVLRKPSLPSVGSINGISAASEPAGITRDAKPGPLSPSRSEPNSILPSPVTSPTSSTPSLLTAPSTSSTTNGQLRPGEPQARAHRTSLSGSAPHLSAPVSLQRKGSMGKTALSRSASLSSDTADDYLEVGPRREATRVPSSSAASSRSSSEATTSTTSTMAAAKEPPAKKGGFLTRMFQKGNSDADSDSDRQGLTTRKDRLTTPPRIEHTNGLPKSHQRNSAVSPTSAASLSPSEDSDTDYAQPGELSRTPSSHSLFRLNFSRRESGPTQAKPRPLLPTRIPAGGAPTSANGSPESPATIVPPSLADVEAQPGVPLPAPAAPAAAPAPPARVEDSRSHHSLFKDLIRGKGKRDSAAAAGAGGGSLNGYANGYANGSPVPSDATGGTIGTQPSLSEIPRGATGAAASFTDKYGKVDEVLGKGAYATVKLARKRDGAGREVLVAVKEFRKRKKDESEKDFLKKLGAEFSISSRLRHENIIETLDLIQNEQRHWCEVMEYCPGGDLYARIVSSTLSDIAEINCFFKQVVLGMAYLHSVGIAHRDLKPENLLLDAEGRIIKITDFGVSTVFRSPTDSKGTVVKCKGMAGSSPYIAPEEHTDPEYDPQKVDVWASGIIYYTLLYNSVPWQKADRKDPHYKYFLSHRNGQFWPIDRLPPGQRRLINRILDPNPHTRITVDEILANEWFKAIPYCRENGTCGSSLAEPDPAAPPHHPHLKPVETHKLTADERKGQHDRYGSGTVSRGAISIHGR